MTHSSSSSLHFFVIVALSVLLSGECWTPKHEVSVLHTIYVNSHGEDWTWKNESQPDWNFTSSGAPVSDPCSTEGRPWEGIMCSSSGAICSDTSHECHITTISLNDYNLVGFIPSSISNLSHLEYLDFWVNHLTGTIPPELFMLKNLTYLDLDENLLEGTIPSEFYQLTTLKTVYMSKNFLIGSISSELSKLSNLQTLSLNVNSLTGSIPSIETLSNLMNFGVQQNQLTGTIPSAVGKMKALKLYIIADNALNGTIPEELGQLTNMLYLALSLNNFIGSIPPSLGNLTKMLFCGLHFNSLTSTIPPELGSLGEVRNLWLHGNFLTGQLPTEGALLGKLESFYVYDNLFTGTLPSNLGVLPNVMDIKVGNNLLTGSIPPSVGRMTHVSSFDASGNFLSGSLPDELGNLSSLRDLELHDNHFSGALPSTIGKLKNLQDLELSDNKFSSLPIEFGNLTNLKKAFIQNNKLKGEISDIFWQPAKMVLEHLDFSGNLLHGSIPAKLFAVPGIRTVALSINCFSGELPVTICSAMDVNVLSMDGVGAADDCAFWSNIDLPIARRFIPLEGSIPECMWSMDNLTVMHLSGNGLTGTIGSFSSASKMLNMSLAHNRLSGTIPRLLQENGHVLNLDLSYNKITGEYKYGCANSNQSITLQVNRLSGRLDKQALERAKYLNILVDNRFSCDTIPSSDVNANDYSCESIDLDKSLFTMMSFIVFLVFVFVIATIYQRHLVKSNSLQVGIETEPYALQRIVTLLANGSLYFSCLDNLKTLTHDHFLLKISNFSEELFAIFKGCIGLCVVSIILSIPLFSLKFLDHKDADGEFSTYTHMYSWLFSASYTSGVVPAVLLLLSWGVLMIFFVYFIWRFSKKYGKLFFERFSASNTTNHSRDTLKMVSVVLCNCGINAVVNVLYIFLTTQNNSRLVTVMIQLGMAIWKIFTSVVIVPILAKPIKDFEKCIKTRLFMLISNSMIIPCLVAMRISPSCFESMFRRPDPISSLYSYEDCSLNVLKLESGVMECREYAHFSVDIPPLIPPFSYNYDCSSVILTAYIPVYIYMYALLSIVPLSLLLFGVSFRYYWIPEWLQSRLAGIMWPYRWSMRESTAELGESIDGSKRVRTFSDMSTDSSISDEESESTEAGSSLQQAAEPHLMINIVPIITQLMHNLFILSTFGLCSPFLAIVVVCCNSSNIIMWKILLGRFVTCRVIKSAEIAKKRRNAKCRERAISQEEFLDLTIHELMKKNTSSTHDAALIALSEQLNNAKGIFAVCIWPILLSSGFFFIFVSLDIAGDRVSWTGGLWIPAVLCVLPLMVVWIGMKILMKKRAASSRGMEGSESSGAGTPEGNESNALELTSVINVLHVEEA